MYTIIIIIVAIVVIFKLISSDFAIKWMVKRLHKSLCRIYPDKSPHDILLETLKRRHPFSRISEEYLDSILDGSETKFNKFYADYAPAHDYIRKSLGITNKSLQALGAKNGSIPFVEFYSLHKALLFRNFKRIEDIDDLADFIVQYERIPNNPNIFN